MSNTRHGLKKLIPYAVSYGQSYEMFFVDDEGYLDYQRLVNEIDAAIRAGKMSFLEGVDKRKLSFYRNYQPHPQLSALEIAQLRLGERNGYSRRQ
jgi:hypothetical protein